MPELVRAPQDVGVIQDEKITPEVLTLSPGAEGRVPDVGVVAGVIEDAESLQPSMRTLDDTARIHKPVNRFFIGIL